MEKPQKLNPTKITRYTVQTPHKHRVVDILEFYTGDHLGGPQMRRHINVFNIHP